MDSESSNPVSSLRGSQLVSALRDHLIGAPPHQVGRALQDLDLNDVFECLDDPDNEQVTNACEVLEMCFSNLSIDFVVKKATENILKSLQHQKSIVRLMAINEIHREVKTNKNLYPLPDSLNVAIAVTKCIGDPELKVATKAIEIVSMKDWLQHPQIISEIQTILDSNDTSNRCKCYEVILNIAKENPSRLKDQDLQTLLHRLIRELKTDDTLMQLNVVELLSNLAVTPQGLDFLIENEVLKQLSEMVKSLEGNSMANLIIPGLMKFFGTIAHKYPTEIYNNYPVIVDSLFDAINTNNVSILPTALDTLGYVGATVEGKLALGSLGRVFISSLRDVGGLIKNSQTDIRVRALNCVEYLMGVKVEDDGSEPQIDQRVTLMTREWFRELSEKPKSMEVIFNICKNPFPELRINALKVLASVCQHKWGEELIKTTPGLIEFLLDRSVEHEKESKHIKYDIICALSTSDLFDTSTILRLKMYVQEGPFFIQSYSEVAVEGEE